LGVNTLSGDYELLSPLFSEIYLFLWNLTHKGDHLSGQLIADG